MFTVEVRNVGLLYEALQEGQSGHLARLQLGQKPVGEIETTIKRIGDNYDLESRIHPFTLIPPLELHPGRIVPRLPEYEVLAGGNAQVVLKKIERYFLERGQLGPELRIQQRLSSKEELDRQLHEYAEVLQVVVESFYPEESVPEAIYILGSKIPSGKKEHQIPALNTDNREGPQILLERKIEIVNPQVPFEAIGGSYQAKEEMRRIYSDIVRPDVASFFGRDPQERKGYLLHGDSGTGKTLLVKALATKLKEELSDRVKFYAVDYSSITSIYRGGEAQATALLFDLVKQNEQQGLSTLLFLDEIHLIGQRKKEYNEALDTLLAQLDGMTTYKKLTVIGATYLPVESLDPALIRPGRLSVQITISPPTADERAEIFSLYVEKRRQLAAAGGNMHLFADLDISQLAEASANFNGSHIAGVIEKVVAAKEDDIKRKLGEHAALEEFRAAFKPITMEEFLDAIKTYQKVERTSARVGFRV